MLPSIVWDGITIAVIAVFALSAYRKGLLNVLVRFIGAIAVFAASIIYSKTIAAMIYTNVFGDRVAEAVAANLDRFGEPGIEAFTDAVKGVIAMLPPGLSQALDLQAAANADTWYQNFLSANADSLVSVISEQMIAPAATAVLQVVVFFVMFGVGSILINLVAGFFKGVNRIPLLGTANALLGAAFGAIQGALYLYVGAALLWLIMMATGDTLSFVSSEAIAQTRLFRYFVAAGPWVGGAFLPPV